VTIAPPDNSSIKPVSFAFGNCLPLRCLIVANDDIAGHLRKRDGSRTDEAYYWTWSKENVLSFLDHRR